LLEIQITHQNTPNTAKIPAAVSWEKVKCGTRTRQCNMRPPGAPAYDEQPSSSPGSRPKPVPVRFDPSLMRWRNDDDILSPPAVAVSQTSDARQPFAVSSDFCPTARTRKRGVAAAEAGADVWRQRRSGNVNAPRPPPPPPELPESVLAFILRRVACLPGGGIPSVLAAGAVCRGEEGQEERVFTIF